MALPSYFVASKLVLAAQKQSVVSPGGRWDVAVRAVRSGKIFYSMDFVKKLNGQKKPTVLWQIGKKTPSRVRVLLITSHPVV